MSECARYDTQFKSLPLLYPNTCYLSVLNKDSTYIYFYIDGTRIKKVNVLLAYYTYGYGRTTLTAMGVRRLRLRACYAHGYGRTTPTATGVLRSWLRAYYAHGYGRTTLMASGVLRLRLRACYAYGYGRATLTATGVLGLFCIYIWKRKKKTHTYIHNYMHT